MEGVSIIVPTLNEAENITPLLERIHAVLDQQDYDFEIVFSDGASTDATTEIIQVWQDKANVVLVENEQGKGLASAVIAGARAASHDVLVVMDADLSHPPEVIPDLLEPLMSETADMVVGSRYVREGRTPDWPLMRKLISTLATLPARMFTHIKDPLSGFIAVRRERLASIEDEVCGFKIGLELLATAEDSLRVQEIPITFRDRRWGESKLSTGVVQDYIKQLAMLMGIELLPGGLRWLIPVFITVLVMDGVLLTAFLHYGIAPGWAHWFSFLPATVLGGLLAVKTISRNDIREAAGLLNWYFIGTGCVCLLTLFVRSGVIATLLRMHGELTTALVFYLSLLGFLVAYLGTIFWVHSRKGRRVGGRQLRTYYGLGIVFYLMMLRLAYLGGIELIPEELYYYELLTRLSEGDNVGLLPAPAAIGGVGLVSLPGTLLGFRFGVWLLWLISLIFVFSLTRDMYDRQVAFTLVLLFSLVPFFFAVGYLVTSEAVLTLSWCAALYFLYRAVVAEVRAAWIWAGLVLGVGIQLDVRLIVLLAGVLIYLLSSTASQNLLTRHEPYLGVATMLLTFLPTIVIKGGTFAVDVLAQEGYVGPTWVESMLGELFSSIWLLPFILLTPTVMVAGIIWVWRVLKPCKKELRDEAERAERHRIFLLAVFVVPFLIFMIPELFAKSTLCAGGMVWIGLMPAIAVLFSFRLDENTPDSQNRPHRLEQFERARMYTGGGDFNEVCAPSDRVLAVLKRCWWPTVGIMLLLYGMGLHLLAL